ncbi:MAG: diacylglycerol kinase family lipid kinase [Planctomycetes bacterium]|nr:diacylglycerol kinase family lipid kinase [Planctomycetota bacterium]
MAVTHRPTPSPLETVGRRVRVIVNPVSGRGRHVRKLRRLAKILRALKFRPEFFVTRGPGDAARYAVEAHPDTALLLAVGGDGTVNEVANGNIENKVPIALLPAGTGNILQKEFRLPRRVREACRLALEGQVRWIDALRVNGRLSLLVTSAGFDSRIALEIHRNRKGTLRQRDYAFYIAKEVLTHKYNPIDVYADGELLAEGAAHVIVGNARSYGGPFEIACHASPFDGKMDVVALMAKGRLPLLRYLWCAVRGNLDRCPGVIYRQVKRLELRGRADIPYQIDGDPAGFLPVKIEVLPRAIPVVVSG